MELRQYIYLSRLAGRVGQTGLREIMQRSRENNWNRQLSGALLFDGESFGQLLEGPVQQVLAMIGMIRSDSRHTEFQPVYDQETSGARSCAVWRNGYVEPAALDAFRAQAAGNPGSGTLIIDGFLRLLSSADVI